MLKSIISKAILLWIEKVAQTYVILNQYNLFFKENKTLINDIETIF